MCHLFETIKIHNGKCINIEYHQKRINKTFAEIFKKIPYFSLQQIISIPRDYMSGLVKCRIDYCDSDFHVSFTPYVPRQINKLKLVFCDSADYAYKYSDRSFLELCLKQKEHCDDIIIVKNNQITDSSFSNLIFSKNGLWYTTESYLLNGTCRQFLLDKKIVQIAKIDISNYNSFDGIKLINAMLHPEDTKIIPIGNIIK